MYACWNGLEAAVKRRDSRSMDMLLTSSGLAGAWWFRRASATSMLATACARRMAAGSCAMCCAGLYSKGAFSGCHCVAVIGKSALSTDDTYSLPCTSNEVDSTVKNSDSLSAGSRYTDTLTPLTWDQRHHQSIWMSLLTK